MLQALGHRNEMPAPIVTREGMDLVHDDAPKILEYENVVGLPRHQHGLDGLRGRQQDVRRFLPDRLPATFPDIPVPQSHATTHQICIVRDPRVQVVQEGSKRAQIQHRQGLPVFGQDSAQDGEDSGLCLTASGRRRQQHMGTRQDRP